MSFRNIRTPEVNNNVFIRNPTSLNAPIGHCERIFGRVKRSVTRKLEVGRYSADNPNNPRQRSVAIQKSFGLLRRFTPRNDIIIRRLIVLSPYRLKKGRQAKLGALFALFNHFTDYSFVYSASITSSSPLLSFDDELAESDEPAFALSSF